MIVYSDKNIHEGSIDYNLAYARNHFKFAPIEDDAQKK